MSRFSAAQLHDAAITLENEAEFHDRYKTFAPKYNARERRELIAHSLVRVKIRGHDAEDREHLRRYFDDIYGIPATNEYSIKDLLELKFWLDEVKYPNTQPLGLSEPTTSPVEIAEHIDSAISHLTLVSNSLKEILMNKTEVIKIETKTFVNGVDIATMDDASVYALIATQEAQIKELDKIETKPKKLTAEIEKRKAGVQALVDYLDSKE